MRFIWSACLLFSVTDGHAQLSTLYTAADSTFSTIWALEEVTVMAEKRELKPADIPAALTVVTPRSIPGENNPDLRNISGIVPNFYMQEGGLKLSTPLYVRGIGTVSGTPPVGLYVDGVPVFDKNAFVFDLYDIRQIEILRGPQTTLYGRNSINGLVNIHTCAPDKNFGIQAQIGYASHYTQNYQLILNLPLGHFYNKFSFSYNKSKGYFRNRFDHNRRSNPSDSYNIRYQGSAYTGKDWKIAWGMNYNNSFDGGYAYHAVDSLRAKRYTVSFNTPSSYRRELLSSYARLEKNARQMAFRAITSYSWSKDKMLMDADFTELDVFDNSKYSRQHLITQELNLQSADTGRLDWTVGAFGFCKDLSSRYLATFGQDRSYLVPLPVDKARYINQNITWGIAGYGQLSIRGLWPGMTFTAGVRYDFERTELKYRDSILLSGERDYIGLHRSDPRENQEFREWLPKFSLLQQWNHNLSFYLSLSKGYKAGGYNVISNGMASQFLDLAYKKEKLWNYELGMKYFSPNKKFHLNAAVFCIDWRDQQIFVMGLMGPSIKNAGDARSIGGELDLRWELFPRLTYLLAAGYSNSRYYHHLMPEYRHHRVVMAPEFTGNTGFLYQKPVEVAWFRSFSVSTTVTAFGSQYFDEANRLKQDPYFLWNADFSLAGKHLEFHVWGKNMLDKAFFSYMLNNPVGKKLPEYYDMGQSGAPARFGASFTFKF